MYWYTINDLHDINTYNMNHIIIHHVTYHLSYPVLGITLFTLVIDILSPLSLVWDGLQMTFNHVHINNKGNTDVIH